MTDPANLRAWQTSKTKVEPLTDGPPREGYRVREWTKPPGRKEFAQVVEFAVFDRPHRLHVRIVEGPFPVDGTWTLTPDGEGTRVAVRRRGAAARSDAPGRAAGQAHGRARVRRLPREPAAQRRGRLSLSSGRDHDGRPDPLELGEDRVLGGRHRSGGRAPRAAMAPRSSRRAVAAATEPVETTPPPRPQGSCGGVREVTTTSADGPRTSTCWADQVRADGGAGRNAASSSARTRAAPAAGRARRGRARGGSRPRGRPATRAA